jgi:hypothetical protein
LPYFEDLTPYSFLTAADQVSPALVNIGWLSRWHSFSKGPVDKSVLEELLRLCQTPVRLTRGVHRCGMCHAFPNVMVVDGKEITLGNGEIRIPGQRDIVYVAPTLICHYIGDHEYRPPQQFLDAASVL